MSTFIKVDGQVAGPFSDAELRQKFAAGRVSPQTPGWRVGMPEWTTLAQLFPDLAPSRPGADTRRASPPPVPPPLPASAVQDMGESLRTINAHFSAAAEPVVQADALDRLEVLAAPFLEKVGTRLGATGRCTLNYFAHRAVTAGIQRLRLDLMNGARLTPAGEAFLAQASAYLALIAVNHWQRRGLKIAGCVSYGPGEPANRIQFTAGRERDGQRETYSHDFYRDMVALLIKPPQWFPYLHGQTYALESLTQPSPEALYLFGAVLMQSPHSAGNWPRTQKVGGLEEDFQRSRELLVDDLHNDCGLPVDDPALRKLSWWIVFPPYGWMENEVSEYNMMTVFSQISEHQVVPPATGMAYLQALLRSQAVEVRTLAARCLMVYRVAPRDAVEALHYKQALAWRDYPQAAQHMARFQSRLEGVTPHQDWWDQVEVQRRGWLEQLPPPGSHRSAAEGDPDYVALGQIPPERTADALPRFEVLLRRYPNDWILKMIHASLRMKGPDPRGGEAALRELIRHPADCPEGHLRLGTLLKYSGRRDEAMRVFEDAVARWPWYNQAIDSCLWLMTDGMTEPAPATAQAA